LRDADDISLDWECFIRSLMRKTNLFPGLNPGNNSSFQSQNFRQNENNITDKNRQIPAVVIYGRIRARY
jgi:hypothetical protein